MGVYSDQPDPPDYFQVVDTRDCVRYSNPADAQWFMDRINFAYGGTGTNARLDTDNTIRWFGYYALNLGDWLYCGTTPVTDEVLRASALRPVGVDWPKAPAPPPAAVPPAEETASDTTTSPDPGTTPAPTQQEGT